MSAMPLLLMEMVAARGERAASRVLRLYETMMSQFQLKKYDDRSYLETVLTGSPISSEADTRTDPAPQDTTAFVKEAVYYWAAAHYLAAWACEENENFHGAITHISLVLTAIRRKLMFTNSRWELHTSNNMPKLLPLKNPHPLHSDNELILSRKLAQLSRLNKQSNSITSAPPPAILAAESSQRLLYRIHFIVDPETDFRFIAGLPVELQCRIASDMGLYRSVDTKDSQIDITCSIWSTSTTSPSTENAYIMPLERSGFVGVSFKSPSPSPLDHQGRCSIEGVFEFNDQHFNSNNEFTNVYLHFQASNPFILPLITGPFKIFQSADTQPKPTSINNAFDTFRPLVYAREEDGRPKVVLIRERSDSGIHGRAWDSAVVLGLLMQDFFHASFPKITMSLSERKSNDKPLNIIDIGCGVGLSGLMAASLTRCDVTLSDLLHALPLAQENIDLNLPAIKMAGSSVRTTSLIWGDVAKCRELGKYDLIIASDVVYEVEAFDDLIQTLKELCHERTEIWLMYKRRGLEFGEEKEFFEKMDMDFEPLTKANTHQMCEVGQRIGCRFHRYKAK
ncbi:hypothetical protein HDV05_001214 [Chytridiales sp. JEL 0842]|nr:hypothetical protein HDV05_001214 [Chytridiales sp. JEL 0842]